MSLTSNRLVPALVGLLSSGIVSGFLTNIAVTGDFVLNGKSFGPYGSLGLDSRK